MRVVALLLLSILFSCVSSGTMNNEKKPKIIVGSEKIAEYLPLLKGKRVGIVANHSTTINNVHLIDTLLALGVNITKIYSPEHGLRGEVEAGELIDNHFDSKTGIPVLSLYGSRKKPSDEDLKNIDIVIFDMQDVGVRFYTYISTMHYVMEACAENGIPLIVLDRPNPNGWYVDGPVLDTNFRSFVGMHPVPLVHGMTVGEFARMINGEKWLNKGIQCDLTVIACQNYTHDSTYILPVKPSPNLPNQTAIYLYPSLGFFEGTAVSIGRGTDFPFQVFGHPHFTATGFTFTPESRPGISASPPLLNQICNGFDLREYNPGYFFDIKSVNLDWLVFAYRSFPEKSKFFNNYFNNLAGNSTLKEQIINGFEAEQIKNSWKTDIDSFKVTRKKYLLYPDFNL